MSWPIRRSATGSRASRNGRPSQLYVKGEFVGGCDIVTEMTLSGELDELFAREGIVFDKDAAEKIRAANQ